MLKQQQNLQQHLKLSPQQLQVIRLLELPVLEFEDQVKQELQDNPVLEEAGPATEGDAMGEEGDPRAVDSQDLDLGDYRHEDDIPDYRLNNPQYTQNEQQIEINYTGETTLHDNLMSQIGLRDLSDDEMQAAEFIIGNLDTNGYLTRPLQAIADDMLFINGMDLPLEILQDALAQVQDLDPAGIGASDLRECLLLQLERKKATPSCQLAYELIEKHFDLISKRHYEAILKEQDCSAEELRLALEEITHLNPKPGSNFDQQTTDKSQQIIPDFTVELQQGEPTLVLNTGNIPTLNVSRTYQEMYEDYTQHEANQNASKKQALLYMKQKLDAARSFIQAVSTRNRTLELTMQAILAFQRDFFLTGDQKKLRPMILKDIATPTGFDISTISRVSNSKYVQTDFGVFPLKYFFTDATQNASGETISTQEIKMRLAQLIQEEDKQAPYSDDSLTELLQQEGYTLARRTIAKYREQLQIPVARLRKTF